MTHPSTASVSSQQAACGHPEPATVEEINASCRGPVLLPVTLSVLWLVAGSVLWVIASIKLHGPGFLSDFTWRTYGPVKPAAFTLFLYGFASQALLGLALWMLCRLGKTTLVGGFLALVGIVFWNMGVALATLGILGGAATGFEWFELPTYAAPVLFVSYLPIGLCALLTFAARRDRELYVSQWYLLAALVIFPWIFATANTLIAQMPARGAMQAVVGYWYGNNFLTLWLTPAALAVVFYLIPKLAGQPLHSRYLAAFGFWMLMIVGGWAGIPLGARLPAWMPAMSTVASVLMILPIIAVALNLKKTISGQCSVVKSTLALKLSVYSVLAYLVYGVLAALNAHPAVGTITEFTHATSGVTQLALFGFVALAIFAGIYHAGASLLSAEWCGKLAKTHWLLSALGLILSVAALVIGGVLQGRAFDNPDAAFIQSVKKTIPFVGLSTLGMTLWLLGSLALLGNVAYLFKQACANCCKSKEVRS